MGTTGVWILAFKLGLPIVAVVLVVLAGQSTAGTVGAALLGVLVIAVFGLVLWLVFRSDASAHRLGRWDDRTLNWVMHFSPQAGIGPGGAGRAPFPRPGQPDGARARLAPHRHRAGQPDDRPGPRLFLCTVCRYHLQPGELLGGPALDPHLCASSNASPSRGPRRRGVGRCGGCGLAGGAW